MNEIKHTPGPWIYVHNEDRGIFKIGPDNGGMPVASTINQGNKDQEEANARLIAAAPELLEALKAGLDFTMDGTPDKDCSPTELRFRQLALKAIAKAEGKL